MGECAMQMTVGIGTTSSQTGTGPQNAGPVETTASPLVQVLSDGWRAIYPDIAETGISPANISVSRPGFNVNANPVLQVDTVGITTRVRLPYPDQETLTHDHVALSDFVYANDAIEGTANSSTRAYPKPIAMWLNHDREQARASVHVLRLAVAHAYARQGRPVAAVKFIASDGTAQVEQIVSEMAAIRYDASGLSVPHFAAEMDLSQLAQGVLLTIDAVIYPWVGEAFTISLDADAYPSPNLTTLRLLNDRTGGYGAAFAYVDVTLGDDGAGVVSADVSTAQAAPFATIAAAVAAVEVFNLGAYGRANDTGGASVRLVEGVHSLGIFKTQGGSVDVPLVIEAADPAKRDTTILTDGGASTFNSIPAMLKLRDVTLRKTGGSVVFLDSGANSASNLLVTENCLWDANSTNYYGAWVYRVGRFFQVNCGIGAGGDPKQGNFFSTEATMVTAVGCERCAGTITYQAAGCSGLPEFTMRAATGARPDMTGLFLGWNVFTNGSTSNPIISISTPIGPRGVALVGNVVESWGSTSNAAIRLNADSDTNPSQNVVIQHNTVAGERANLMYLDGAVDVSKTAYVKFNLFERLNIKGDVFASRGANIGNWSARFRVGWSHNAIMDGSNNAASYGPASWLGEIGSAGEATGSMYAFENDASHRGTGMGGGDYTPLAGSTMPVVPIGFAAYSVDLMGNPIVAGQSRVGAITTVA